MVWGGVGVGGVGWCGVAGSSKLCSTESLTPLGDGKGSAAVPARAKSSSIYRLERGTSGQVCEACSIGIRDFCKHVRLYFLHPPHPTHPTRHGSRQAPPAGRSARALTSAPSAPSAPPAGIERV